jgi:putative nucleotidyltransferase with HDIG domain
MEPRRYYCQLLSLNEDLLKVRLCALLHDIGKPICWAVKKSWSHHVEFGMNILEDVFGKEIAKTAVSHHTTSAYAKFFHPSTKIERTISLADHIASGADRPKDEDPTYGGAIPSTPVVMTHVLASVNNNKAIYRISAEELISFTEDFKKRFKNALPNEKTFYQVLQYLSKSVLKRIPADTRYPYNDVSLFDHLRLTSAIANCIWTQGYKNENINSYNFSLICADADRISAYINRSSRLPDLRAGSMMISEAVQKASASIKQNLGPECVIFEGGGGFLAVSDTKFADSILEHIRTEFRNALFNDGTISASYVNVSGIEIQRNFAEVWGKAIKSMHDRKLAREEVIPDLEDEKPLCDICKIRAAELKEPRPLLVNTLPSFENLCNICKSRREYGKRLGEGTSIDNIADSNHLVSILKIDGDDIGEIISGRHIKEIGKQPTPSRISTISRLVHEACESELGKIVQRNSGLKIYSGGDDILAVLPGNSVFNTAIEIQQTFSELMGGKSSASMSAGICIFNYKLPIYVGLEAANQYLELAKNNEGKSSISFDVLLGVFAKNTSTKRAYKWLEFKKLLQLVDFMNSETMTISQLRNIVGTFQWSTVSESVSQSQKKIEAELLVKYNIGRGVLDWDISQFLLDNMKKNVLVDAFILYNILRTKVGK